MSANINNIEGGYKATLSNPNASEDAKKHAQEMLDKIAKGETVEAANPRSGELSEEEKHRHHVEGGYKATLANANASEEAKKHAQAMLDKLAKGEKLSEEDLKFDASKKDLSESDEHEHRVIGGYKATLSNANASEEAKKHAQDMIDKYQKSQSAKTFDHSKHRHHVIGGYKATLSNANASEEAKKRAQEMIDKYERDNGDLEADDFGLTGDVDHDHRVIGGYKAAISNSNTSEEAREHARHVVESYEKEFGPVNEKKELTDDEKHRHHVIGGYKATLANSNASEEAKKHAQEMLDRLEKGEELPESEKRGLKRSSDDVEGEKGKQGFASMPKEKVQEIASKGGRTLHAGEEPLPKKGKTENSTSESPSTAK